MRSPWLRFCLVVGLAVLLSGCSSFMPGPEPRLAYLKADYPRMVVELDYQAGRAPRQDAVSLLQTRIQEVCHKPEGVQVDRSEISVSRSVWSAEDLRDAEREHRSGRTGGNTAHLYVLFVGGRYEGDTSSQKVIGIMYSRSSFAIFKDTLEAVANPTSLPLFTAADVERSVIVHELGHVLGLVNLGTKMITPHEDPDHPGHSSNKDSVMYWAVESDAIMRFFTGPPPTQFDANDRADLRAAGGK